LKVGSLPCCSLESSVQSFPPPPPYLTLLLPLRGPTAAMVIFVLVNPIPVSQKMERLDSSVLAGRVSYTAFSQLMIFFFFFGPVFWAAFEVYIFSIFPDVTTPLAPSGFFTFTSIPPTQVRQRDLAFSFVPAEGGIVWRRTPLAFQQGEGPKRFGQRLSDRSGIFFRGTPRWSLIERSRLRDRRIVLAF